MNPKHITAAVLVITACVSPHAPAHADEDPRVDELVRRVDVLTEELENMRIGAAADTAVYARRSGLAPAASKVYGIRRGTSVGGYGEMLWEDFDRTREDDALSGKTDQMDFLRQIIYVGHKFSDELLFNSEIEIEHAGIGGSLTGEVVLEFAYVEWAPDPRIGARAGMVLIPVGFINELHEPPIFIGAKRPDVERDIIPTTWRANGAGVFGALPGGWEYRAYVTEGLDARKFSASSTIRSGRQSGGRSKITRPGFSARLDWTGAPGVVIGGSVFAGNAWQDPQPDTLRLDPQVTIGEVHASVQVQGFEARALYAQGSLGGAGTLSDALGLTGTSRLGGRWYGFYAEAAYDVMPLADPASRWGVLPYARFEMLDTQEDVPGGAENPANERTTITTGLAVKPHPNVVLKGERQFRRNEAETGISQWNVQLGYLF